MRLIPVRGRVATEELKQYITTRHYLESTPPEGIVKLWVTLDNRRIGALMYGRATNRHWAELKILELTRCIFEDDTPPNVESRALAMSRKYIRTYLPHIRLVLTCSSTGQGHDGTIYEADGWCNSAGGKLGLVDHPEYLPPDWVHKLPPSPYRAMLRSITPPGFARAFFEANK